MRRLVDTSTLDQATPEGFSEAEVAQLYNGLDCCLTTEIWEEVSATYAPLRGEWGPQYSFARALQAPYLAMMEHGFAVDMAGRWKEAQGLQERVGVLRALFARVMEGAFSLREANPGSTKQLKLLFYDLLHLPPQWKNVKGVKHVAVDREALEKLSETYLHAAPLINIILAIRDLTKQLEVFECPLDVDGRFRAGYNIVGTETGRPSSSANAFGTGRNVQNIDPGLRHVFQADRGFRLGQVDLEQVEARDVGFIEGALFDDWTFLDNCESGDLHTNNCQLIWPELGWTGDPKRDKVLAEREFYREFSYRDMAKRGGHLSNYFGTPWTMARHLKVPLRVAEDFQARYCRGEGCAYPAHQRWWNWTATELQTSGVLRTLFGFTRRFLGRPNDPATLREAIAFQPQGTTAARMNLGLWRVWRHEPRVALLAQGFDSITFQYEDKGKEYEDDVLAHVLDLIRVRIVSPSGRPYVVPGEAKIGWNWGSEGGGNPDGLRKWSPSYRDGRVRQRYPGIV